eukprot:scaffold303173_cov31-Tisochrysis_lutea.AAC.2
MHTTASRISPGTDDVAHLTTNRSCCAPAHGSTRKAWLPKRFSGRAASGRQPTAPLKGGGLEGRHSRRSRVNLEGSNGEAALCNALCCSADHPQ